MADEQQPTSPASPANFRDAMAARNAQTVDPPMVPEGSQPAPASGGAGVPPAGAAARAALNEPEFPDFGSGTDDDTLVPEADQLDQQMLPEHADEAADDAPVEPEFTLETELHGMSLREWAKAIRDGMLPSNVLDKLQAEYTIDGRPVKLGLHEYPNGFLRQSDYSRKTQQLKELHGRAQQLHDQAQSRMDMQRDMFEAWKRDPATARRDLRRMGMGETIYAIAQQIGGEIGELMKLPEEARRLAIENKRLREQQEDEQYQRELQQQSQQSEQQQFQLRQQTAAYQQAFEQLIPPAFDRHGLDVNSPWIGQQFNAHFNAIWDGRNETFAHAVDEASAATKQELERYTTPTAAQTNGAPPVPPGTQPQTPAAQPLPPRRVPGGAAAPRQKRGGTIADFAAWRQGK